MNERELRHLFRRILTSLPAAIAGVACGGTVTGTIGHGDPNGNASGGERADSGSCPSGHCGSGGRSQMETGGATAAGGLGGSFVVGTGGFLGRVSGSGGLAFGSGGAVSNAGGVGAGGVPDPCAPVPPGGFCPPPVCVPYRPGLTDAGSDGGYITGPACAAACPALTNYSCQIVSSQGEAMFKCYQFCEGRRPEGLAPGTFGDTSVLGQYFAQIAYLEAASVAAFRRLYRELSRHGAPRSLRLAARRAAHDEIRHARITRNLAHRYGGTYVPPNIRPGDDRPLEAMAIENAIEGCVRETFGALTATFQARHASDPEIRKAMRTIARDETRHAALAWRVHRWAERHLVPDARRRVLAEHRAAAAALVEQVAHPPSPAAVAMAGAPSSELARAMARAMADGIAA